MEENSINTSTISESKDSAFSRLILFSILLVLCATAFGQKPRKVMWNDWYDSTAYANGPQALITGFGKLSDSLSLVYNGKTIFEYQEQYYLVNNLADYYFWFTRKYEFLFREEISIYEELYYAGDSYRLAGYVNKNYKGKKMPVKFRFPHNSHIPINTETTAIPYGSPTVQRFHKQ